MFIHVTRLDNLGACSRSFDSANPGARQRAAKYLRWLRSWYKGKIVVTKNNNSLLFIA